MRARGIKTGPTSVIGHNATVHSAAELVTARSVKPEGRDHDTDRAFRGVLARTVRHGSRQGDDIGGCPQRRTAMTATTPRQAVDGSILVGLVGAVSAETALRTALAEAEHRGAAVRVVAAGPAPAIENDLLCELVERWAEKYPGITVTTEVRRRVDAAVTLVAATRCCALAVVPKTSDPAGSALLKALRRRAHCPVVVVDG
jgi:hypothetical protein